MAFLLRQEGKRAGLVRLWRRKELSNNRILIVAPCHESGEHLK